jgi:SnoaL-like domain
MLDDVPEVVKRYFDLDARRDIDGIVALFTDDATVVDEAVARRGVEAIRDWQTGPASEFRYTTTITGSEPVGKDRYRVIGRLEGNFPGGTAELKWEFAVDGDRVSRLEIAP